MATFTSTRAGSWSAVATWGGSGPPATGDLAIIAVVQTAVSATANNGSGLIRLTVGSTTNWTTGQYAYVSGVTGTTEANGLWVVTVVDGTHLDLQSSTFANAYVSGGNANCVVAVDDARTVGATTSVGIGVTINGTSISQLGVLIVTSAGTLTLQGFDQTTHAMMQINQFGLFAPQPGSTIVGGVPSDFASLITNNGRFEAIGTSGSHITFTVPAGNVNWGLAGSESSRTFGTGPYDDSGLAAVNGTAYAGTIMNIALSQGQISNSGGTALGSSGDTSLSVSASGYTLTTLRSSFAAIAAAGDYYVDYDTGVLYVGVTSLGSAQSLSCTYKKLDRTTANWRGWGIYSKGAQTGCTALFQYCDFQYMGASGNGYLPTGTSYRVAAPVNLYGHKSTHANSNDSSRLAYVKNSTFNACFRYVGINACVGDSTEPIYIQGNTCNEASGGGIWDGMGAYASTANAAVPQSYITIDSNTFNTRGTAISWDKSISADHDHVSITNNTGVVGTTFFYGPGTAFGYINTVDGSQPNTADLYMAGNVIRGVGENGGWIDSRFLILSGTSGHPAIAENNHFHHCHRLGHHQGSYVTWRKNRFGMAYHHGFTGNVIDDQYATDITYQNNLFYCIRTTVSQSSAVQCGYNHRVTVNNLVVAGNTFDGWHYGAMDFSDTVDNSGPTLATNVVVVDNIIANNVYAFSNFSSATQPQGLHVLECDYNVVYNQGTGFGNGLAGTKCSGFYQGSNKYNRLTGAGRNINGVALFDASYTTAKLNQSLVYTVTSLGVTHTIAWGGGATQSLIYDSGTSAGVGLRTLACVGKSTWAANNNSIRTKWLWVVSGTGAGQARAIIWVSANVAYAVTAINNGATGYAVGDYLTGSTGTADTPGARILVKVSSVSAGVITGLRIISGGGYASTPSNPVSFTRVTGSGTAGVTASFSFAPGLLLSPDLTTDLDATSVFAIHESMVTCTDSGGTQTVKCGFYLPDPASWQTAVQIPSTTQTDTGIDCKVVQSPTTNPNFVTSVLSSVATDYQWSSGSAKDAGTSDNAPSTDYFGTTRPQGAAIDIGFFEMPQTTGTGVVTMAALTAVGTGTASSSPASSGTGAVTLGAFTVAGTGTFLASATGAVTLGTLVVSGAGTALASNGALGTGAVTLGVLTAAGIGSFGTTGRGSVILAALSVTGVGTISGTSDTDLVTYPDPFGARFLASP